MDNAYVFRCDADGTIGVGHAMRMLALAEAARARGAPCALIARRLPEVIAKRFAALGARVDILGDCAAADFDVAAIADLARPGAWIVVDAPQMTTEQFRALSARSYRVAVFDDGERQAFGAIDLIINPNLAATEENYAGRASSGVARALGLEFLPLRAAFAEARPDLHRGEAPRALITMGGADPGGLTAPIMRAIAPLCGLIELSAVIGPAFLDRKERIQAIKHLNADISILDDPDGLAEALARHDVVVTMGGVTLWEAAAMQCAIIGVAYGPAQRAAFDAAYAHGAVHAAFDADTLDMDGLARAVETLARAPVMRRVCGARAGALVDGRGAARCLDKFESLRMRRAS